MSRLDSFIRRLTAQRACLDAACGLIAGMDGPVLEIGLGNGRTFDHLRQSLPDRRIFVFDRQVACHPDCVPEDENLLLGELTDTLVRVGPLLPSPAMMVHSDIGTGHADIDAEMAAIMARLLPPLLAPGAVVLSDQDIPLTGAEDIPLPEGIAERRYFFRRLAP